MGGLGLCCLAKSSSKSPAWCGIWKTLSTPAGKVRFELQYARLKYGVLRRHQMSGPDDADLLHLRRLDCRRRSSTAIHPPYIKLGVGP